MKRRTWLAGAAGIGAAGVAAYYGWRGATSPHRHAAPPAAGEALAAEAVTERFTNPLRLGADGLFARVSASKIARLVAREVSLEVMPGLRAPIWAYTAEVDGRTIYNPTLTVRRGDRVRLTLENRLPKQPTVIHWHGIPNDEHNDGAGFKLAAVGERYEYDFTVDAAARLAWYHTHAMGIAGEQAYRGLAGLLVVEDDASDALARALDLQYGVTDLPLVIQDKTFDHEGQFTYSTNRANWFHGNIGDEIFVNLTARPVVALPKRIVRLRMLNGSTARTYRLAFVQGTRVLPCMLAGTDGGLLREAVEVRDLYLAAAQRVEVLLDLRQASDGVPVFLKTLAFDPMHNEAGPPAGAAPAGHVHGGAAAAPAEGHAHHHGGIAPEGAELAILQIDVKPFASTRPLAIPAALAPAASIDTAGLAERRFVLDHADGLWRINGKVHDMADFSVAARRGTREIWTFENAVASMPHPMHIHAFDFRVIDRRGTPEQARRLAIDAAGRTAQDLGPLDTVLVWPGETVRVRVDFTQPFAGEQRYMLHCHNLEHEDLGMMTNFKVTP